MTTAFLFAIGVTALCLGLLFGMPTLSRRLQRRRIRRRMRDDDTGETIAAVRRSNERHP